MKNKKIVFAVIIIICFIFFINIMSNTPQITINSKNKLNSFSQATWNNLSRKRIFFGHHSVGTNIIQGVEDLLKESPNIKLKIVHLREIGNVINSPAFVHGNVGKNTDPLSKINSFRRKIEAGYGQDVDIALFKFCFVDFTPNTDVKKIFQSYKSTMDTLIKEYPKTTFVAVTTPLTCYAPGPDGWLKRVKDFIKDIVGKINVYDNSSANVFNNLLVHEYSGKIPIFDLAKIESTQPDGSREFYTKNGITYYELVQEYTTDGGHLNGTGRRVIAEEFLAFLARLSTQ